MQNNTLQVVNTNDIPRSGSASLRSEDMGNSDKNYQYRNQGNYIQQNQNNQQVYQQFSGPPQHVVTTVPAQDTTLLKYHGPVASQVQEIGQIAAKKFGEKFRGMEVGGLTGKPQLPSHIKDITLLDILIESRSAPKDMVHVYQVKDEIKKVFGNKFISHQDTHDGIAILYNHSSKCCREFAAGKCMKKDCHQGTHEQSNQFLICTISFTGVRGPVYEIGSSKNKRKGAPQQQQQVMNNIPQMQIMHQAIPANQHHYDNNHMIDMNNDQNPQSGGKPQGKNKGGKKNNQQQEIQPQRNHLESDNWRRNDSDVPNFAQGSPRDTKNGKTAQNEQPAQNKKNKLKTDAAREQSERDKANHKLKTEQQQAGQPAAPKQGNQDKVSDVPKKGNQGKNNNPPNPNEATKQGKNNNISNDSIQGPAQPKKVPKKQSQNQQQQQNQQQNQQQQQIQQQQQPQFMQQVIPANTMFQGGATSSQQTYIDVNNQFQGQQFVVPQGQIQGQNFKNQKGGQQQVNQQMGVVFVAAGQNPAQYQYVNPQQQQYVPGAVFVAGSQQPQQQPQSQQQQNQRYSNGSQQQFQGNQKGGYQQNFQGQSQQFQQGGKGYDTQQQQYNNNNQDYRNNNNQGNNYNYNKNSKGKGKNKGGNEKGGKGNEADAEDWFAARMKNSENSN